MALLIIMQLELIILQRETGSALVYTAFFLMLYREGKTGEVILSITATETTYTFKIKAAHVSAILGTASTRDVSNEVVGGFTGVFIGMYASGNGQANTNPADFDWFDFRCLD